MFLFGSATVVLSSLNSIDKLATHWKQTETRLRTARLTDITYVSSNTLEGGEQVEVVIRNDGDEALAYFEKWDVIVRYQNGTVSWVPYATSSPGWTVENIYLGGSAEVFEPNILNPMETVKIVINLDPVVEQGTTNLATISTPNGISTQATFGWE